MRFSIILPFFNAIESLKEALDSIHNQSFIGDYEVLLINDASNDGSYELALRESKNYSKLSLLDTKSPLPLGPGFARNMALKKARGEYIVFLDADDLLEKDALQELDRALLKNDFDTLVYGLGGAELKEKI